MIFTVVNVNKQMKQCKAVVYNTSEASQ